MHSVSCQKTIFAFSRDNEPALVVKSGETVELATMDCFSNQLRTPDDQLNAIDWDRINPATGPVFVEEAVPGDVLKVTIEKIEVEAQGAMATGEDLGILGDEMIGMSQKIIPIEGGKAIFNEKISIPLNKMIGVIGVAPGGEPVSCGTPGSHGGNMDNKMIGEGTTLYLPVAVQGALFAAGDVHAVMGDGEIGVSGVEIPAKITVRLEVMKDLSLTNPFLENQTHVSTIASDAVLEKAIHTAVHDMEIYVKGRIPLETPEISMLFSAVGSVEICQVVDPLKTVRFTFPRWIFDAY